MRRNRVYRKGQLHLEDVEFSRISDLLEEPDTVVWLDLASPDDGDLAVVAEELGLSTLAVQDTSGVGQRPKVSRHDGYLLLTLYGARIDPDTATLSTSELGVLAGDRWLLTVRKSGDFDMDDVRRSWDEAADLAVHGVPFLLHGLLDRVVEGHLDAAQQLDDAMESMEAALFDQQAHDATVQIRSYAMRKALVGLRRVALPMREVLLTFTRRDLRAMDDAMVPYFADVLEQVLRVAEWTETLRDLVGTIQDTSLQIQNNRINEVMRRLSAYAAIFAAATAITGFYGMNVLFPQVQTVAGAVTAGVLLVAATVAFALFFRHRHWL